MLQAAICILIGITFGIYTTQHAAVFDQSLALLMPLNQLEARIKTVAEAPKYSEGSIKGSQIITDWDQRMDRFKRHINVLKGDNFKLFMKKLKKEGFERYFQPFEFVSIMSILGLKPLSIGFPDHQMPYQEIVTLIDNKSLIDMKCDKDVQIVASKPTIPFALIFNDYYQSNNWTMGNWKDGGQLISINQLVNFDKDVDQSKVLMDLAKKYGGFGSPQTIAHSSGQAVLLGLQPNAHAVHFYTEQYLQVLHLYLNLIPAAQLSESEQKIWKLSFANSTESPFQRYGSENVYWMLPENRLYIKGVEVKIIEGVTSFQALVRYIQGEKDIFATFNNKQARLTCTHHSPKQGDISKEALTFAGNIKNYRLCLYTGTRAYNDYSYYVQLLGLLLEFFFREAFGDHAYLQILYNKITLEIKELADYLGQSIEWSDGAHNKQPDNLYKQGLAQPQLFKTWQEFYDARTGDNKDNLPDDEKNSFPPFKETFKQFLTKIFGSDTWSWSDADFSFQFDETKKDLILKRFLEHAEPQKDLLSEKLNVLKFQLSNLQEKLVELKNQLEKLKEKLS